MVIVHRDHGVYGLDETVQTHTKILSGFYHLKFEKLLKSNNIPYKLVDYENYDGDYFVVISIGSGKSRNRSGEILSILSCM